jgi:hypothetical protein
MEIVVNGVRDKEAGAGLGACEELLFSFAYLTNGKVTI